MFKLNVDLESTVFNLVKDSRAEYEAFIERSYYFSEAKSSDFSFVSSETQEKVNIPFEVYSIVEFLIHSLISRSVGISSTSLVFKPNTDFNPHLFNCLYIYSNLVKPVDYNDQQFRLLDIVFLKHSGGIHAGVVEHQSTQFKVLEVDTISEIQIYVTTSLGSPAPFIHGPVFVVLEFRK